LEALNGVIAVASPRAITSSWLVVAEQSGDVGAQALVGKAGDGVQDQLQGTGQNDGA
jgi:hypothetical protein